MLGWLLGHRASAGNRGTAPAAGAADHIGNALAASLWLLLTAGCATAPPGGTAPVGSQDAPAAAPSPDRGAPTGRQPATVQVQESPDHATRLYTVTPHMQAGSVASPPIVITSIGAVREQPSQAAQFRILVESKSARGFVGFAHAESRQNISLQVRLLQRSRDCAISPACLYAESVIVIVRGDDLRALADRNSSLRFRLMGTTGFVDTAIPAGHIRALLAAVAAPSGGT